MTRGEKFATSLGVLLTAVFVFALDVRSTHAALYSVYVRAAAFGATDESSGQDVSETSFFPSLTRTAGGADGAEGGYTGSGTSTGFAAAGILRFALGTSASGPGIGGASGDALAETSYEDTITVTSDTLPEGTPVQFAYLSHVHFQFFGHPDNGQATFQLNATSNAPVGNVSITHFYSQSYGVPASGTPDLDGVIDALVGGTITVSANFAGSLNSQNQDPDTYAQLDASNTASLSFTPIGSDFGFSSAGGGLYLIPEPSSAALVLVAFAGSLRRRRKLLSAF